MASRKVRYYGRSRKRESSQCRTLSLTDGSRGVRRPRPPLPVEPLVSMALPKKTRRWGSPRQDLGKSMGQSMHEVLV